MFILWLFLCVLVGFIANSKFNGRSFLGWTVLSAVISPLLAGICLMIAGDKTD